MNKIVLMMFVALLCSFPVQAAGPGAVRKTVESSMLVTGWVTVSSQGSVSKLELDEPDKLPKGVVSLVERAGETWRFEPVMVDGVVRAAKARMSLRIVARKIDADRYEIGIRSGYFGEQALKPEERRARGDSIKPLKLRSPVFPMEGLQMGARGTVYLVVKVGRLGTVEDLFAEQVNLQVIGSENEMQRMRDVLAKSAMSAAKSWTFELPKAGKHANEEHWYVRVPVAFEFYGNRKPEYGQWVSYVPGPTRLAPWDTGFDPSQSPDAMIAGVFYVAGDGMRLLTPLQPG